MRIVNNKNVSADWNFEKIELRKISMLRCFENTEPDTANL